MERWVFGPSRLDRARQGVCGETRFLACAHEAHAAAASESPLRAAYTSPPPTLFLAGEIDESTYRDLLEVLDLTAASTHHQLLVDMADVVYCDLAGLRAIISLAPAERAGPASVDQLVIQHLPAQLSTVVRVLGWDSTPGLFLADVAP